MAQLKETKSTILATDESKFPRWSIHEKMRGHAQKVKTHVKKHHKKYLWWFFAWFAIAKTIKVIIAAVWILMWLNHVPGTMAADYEWCMGKWEQWQFLNDSFWRQWQDEWGIEGWDKLLINALFWEDSAYTKWWMENKCVEENLKVVAVYTFEDIMAYSNGLGSICTNCTRVDDNTIFVLMEKNIEASIPDLYMWRCTAIVSPVESQIYTLWIRFSESPYSILDNVGLSAYSLDENSPARNDEWVVFWSTHSDTVNDVQAYSYEWYGFALDGGDYETEIVWVHNILLNNLQSFWNTNWGMVFACGSEECSMNNITVNNSQFYRNGREYGLGWWISVWSWAVVNAWDIVLNNIQTYNNGKWIEIDSNAQIWVILNNVMTYNNYWWIYSETYNSYFNTMYFLWNINVVCNDKNLSFEINDKSYYDPYFQDYVLSSTWVIYETDSECYGYDYITNPVAQSFEDEEKHFLFRWDENRATDLNSSGVMWFHNAIDEKWWHVFWYSYWR